MGRPKKNWKKAPEEKKNKKGVTYTTRAGLTMHCSICHKPDHNKKGHYKYVQEQQSQGVKNENGDEDAEIDAPNLREHIIPQNPNPINDPTHVMDSMVYRMGQEVLNAFSSNYLKMFSIIH